jgi:hypothetical protein
MLALPTAALAQYRQPSHAYPAQVRYYFDSPYPYTYGYAAPSFQWGSFGAYKRTYQFSGEQRSYNNDFFQQTFR